jgi:hypothetical protein
MPAELPAVNAPPSGAAKHVPASTSSHTQLVRTYVARCHAGLKLASGQLALLWYDCAWQGRGEGEGEG